MRRNELNFSSPETRRAPALVQVLLSLFSAALLCCIIVTIIFYIYFSANSAILTYRHQMNTAASNAQAFFERRELLLQEMAAASINLAKVDSHPIGQVGGVEAKVYPLRDTLVGDNFRGLLLTQRDIAEFRQNHTHLIYTSKQSQRTTSVLPSQNNLITQIEKNQEWLLRQLSNNDWQRSANGKLPIIWLSSPEKNDDRLFIYMPVDIDNPEAGWLGLTFTGLASDIAFSSVKDGGYILVNPQGIPASYDEHSGMSNSCIAKYFAEDSLSSVGGGILPENLELRTSVGVAGWSLVYCVPLSHLLSQNMPVFQAALVFGLILIILVILSIRYLHRHLAVPALEQFNALLDSELLNRKIVERAPVGLGLVRCRDAELLLSNELVQSWIQIDPDWFSRISTNMRHLTGYELRLSDGRAIQLSCTPASYGGEPVILCVLNDITELKAIESSLVKATRMAESANQAKTLFITTMSHEIRTPLYGILGTLELFSLGGVNDQQREYLKTLQYSSSSLLRIVNDSLDLSSIEAGQLTLENMSFSPMELVERVVTAYAARAESKNLNIYSVCDTDVPAFVMGDEIRIRQILDNLVNNAIKFTYSGHVVLRLHVAGYDKNSVNLIFQVTDTGIGIAPAHLPHLFEPYFRSAEIQMKSVQGSGLGLSICSRLAQIMAGELKAISEIELGTHITFEVALSLAEDSDTAPPIKLLPDPVYVTGAIPEVVSNICSWLRFWGAQAQPYRGGTLLGGNRAVVVRAWPPSIQVVESENKHIVALPLSLNSNKDDLSDIRVASAYSVVSIGRAVQAAQQGEGIENPISIPSIPERLNLRLLVVDDNPISQVILREQLNILGCESVIAANGHEALKIKNIDEFDVVLTDLHMPVMDGYHFARELRNSGFYRPIIGLTANAYPDEHHRGYAYGINTLLRKPLSLMQLRVMLYSIKNLKS